MASPRVRRRRKLARLKELQDYLANKAKTEEVVEEAPEPKVEVEEPKKDENEEKSEPVEDSKPAPSRRVTKKKTVTKKARTVKKSEDA